LWNIGIVWSWEKLKWNCQIWFFKEYQSFKLTYHIDVPARKPKEVFYRNFSTICHNFIYFFKMCFHIKMWSRNIFFKCQSLEVKKIKFKFNFTISTRWHWRHCWSFWNWIQKRDVCKICLFCFLSIWHLWNRRIKTEVMSSSNASSVRWYSFKSKDNLTPCPVCAEILSKKYDLEFARKFECEKN